MWGAIKQFIGLESKHFKPMFNMVVLITGCDCGFGFIAALELLYSGFTVVAGMYEGPESEAALKMREMCSSSSRLHQVKLDITNQELVDKCIVYVENLIQNNTDHYLYAIVNNAGVMIMGDFEWQTDKNIQSQVSVNLLGTWRITKASLPLLRKTARHKNMDGKPRIITVGSHCGLYPLPMLSVYSSTKAALNSWCKSLRLELKSLGIHVINFIPGNMSSNIMSKQKDHFLQMKKSMSNDQEKIYGKRIDDIMSYMSQPTTMKSPDAIDDKELLNKLMDAITAVEPWSEYKSQSWRYAFYYTAFQIMPYFISDWLVEKFLKMPKTEYLFEDEFSE